MNTQNAPLDLILDLDARHDELMLKLDELNQRVEQALVQCQGYRFEPGGPAASGLIPHRDR